MLDVPSYILGKKAGGGEGGTSNYNQLSNKPSINDVTLSGNKTTSDLGIIIPTKTSDLTNDGDGSGLFSLTNYAETNVNGSGIYFGNSNDVNLRKKIDDTHYLDYPVETTTNKVTSISSSSTNTQYPSAKAVYDNEILQILSVQNSSQWNNPSSSQYNTVSISQVNQHGNKFTVANDKITCNDDITFLISFSATITQSTGGSNKFIRITKNGTDQFTILFNTTGTHIPISASEILLEGKTGDYFEIKYYGINTDYIDTKRLNATLIVENHLAPST